ncbi:hypothetical protein SGL43_03043 [Streptomyces globisporus]|uniref:Uncharacterized protein n=1 Tax=Streptomyces globisporus TaxID=1908 RepID=A0ABN8V3U1_STRGL|nr:hypothetical protein SGL43_03043 [Streptomyces globisporus]
MSERIETVALDSHGLSACVAQDASSSRCRASSTTGEPAW